MRKIKLTGSDRYSLKGELFEKGKLYVVDDAKAEHLLASLDEFDRHYFIEVHDNASATGAAHKAAAGTKGKKDKDKKAGKRGKKGKAGLPGNLDGLDTGADAVVDGDDDDDGDAEDEGGEGVEV